MFLTARPSSSCAVDSEWGWLAFVLHKVYDSRFKKPRMGRQDGFGNPMTKKLHDIGARFMIETALCIHENVTEYQEDNAHKLLRNR